MPKTPLERFHAVIPAGGVGSRLWPLSRAAAPKFLHDLTGSGRTLLQGTWDRLVPIAGDRIAVVAGVAHEAGIMEQLEDLKAANLFLEQSPRDSTAAIALAAAVLSHRESDVIIGAGSLVPPGKRLASGYLYVGSPVKQARELTAEEREFLRYSAAHYVRLANKHKAGQ